jgi:O-antigen/teichoic acid export membrane protein
MIKDLHKIYSGSTVVFIGKLLNAATQYLIILLLGRFLGPAEVGLFFLGKAVLRFCNIGGTFGLSGSLLKFIPEYIVKEKFYNVHMLIKFAIIFAASISIFLALVLNTTAGVLSVYLFGDENLVQVIRLFAICLPLYTVLTIVLACIRSFRDMLSFSVLENIILPGGHVVIALILFIYSRDVQSVILAFMLSILLSILIGLILLKRNLPDKERKNIDKISRKKILSYSMPFMGSGIIGFFLLWTDTIMIGVFMNAENVGIYNGAVRIALLSNIVLASVNSIFAPVISRLYTKGSMADIELAYKTTVKWIIHLSLPCFLIIFIFSDEIMGLYGPQFIHGSTALIILSLGQLVSISVGSAGYLLNMTGRAKVEFMNKGFLVALNLFLNWYLIPLMGIVGAALATASSITLVNALRLFENYKYLNIHPFSLKILNPFWEKYK